jgi:unsaturated rhamnogalacturonyl hydrolase
MVKAGWATVRSLIAMASLILLTQSCSEASPGITSSADSLPNKTAIHAAMKLVNEYWINTHADPGDNGWARATYFEGDLAMYQVSGEVNYLQYAIRWGERNQWGLSGGNGTRFADNQCAGGVYLELNQVAPVPQRIADITTSINGMVNSPANDDWYWIDALHMAMPVFAKLGVLHNDTTYFDKMYDLYRDAKSRRGLYNSDDALWYRDESFLPPRTTPHGEPVYWSRGNGWVFAAHVRVLQELPANDPHRPEYLATFQNMAAALRRVQRPDGFWNVSLADPDDFAGPETSGTALFTYGLAWGINNGYLDEAAYRPVVTKAWNGMVRVAVHPDGFLGYVQGVACEPASAQPVTYDTTADFGVGAFLLAGSELSKF